MRTFQIKLLAWTFAALLPPRKDEEENYYRLLGLTKKKCSTDDIRKAYKKKSLRYHPDKLAQKFGPSPSPDPQNQFTKVKEAYETLVHYDRRRVYDVLGPTGVLFYDNPSSVLDPSVVLRNLGNARPWDKAKLFVFSCLLIGCISILPILVCSKVDQDLRGNGGRLVDTDWMVLLIPLWIWNLLYLAIQQQLRQRTKKNVTSREVWNVIQLLFLFLLEIFLALKWDGHVPWTYGVVLIPAYLHQGTLLFRYVSVLRRVRADVAKMVTVSLLEKTVLNEQNAGGEFDEQNDDGARRGRLYADLNEAEKEEINKRFILVDVPHTVVDEEDEDELLMQIALSPDYRQRMALRSGALAAIRSILLIRVPFLVLLVLQLDRDKHWSWFTVFSPIWIKIGWTWLSSCFTCCCTNVAGGETSSSDAISTDDAVGAPSDNGGAKKGATTTKGEVSKVQNVDESKKDRIEPTNSLFPTADGNSVADMTTTTVVEVKDETSLEEIKDALHDASQQVLDPNDDASVSDYPIMSPLYVKEDLRPFAAALDREHDLTQITVDVDEKTENDNSTPEVDSDTFRAWQSAQAEAESHAVEKQAMALSSCCGQIVFAVMLTLFLVKLNGAQEDDESSSDRGDYSSFWVAFPLFFFFGIVICCIGCLICSGVEPDTLDSVMKRGGGTPQSSSGKQQPTATTNEQEGASSPRSDDDIESNNIHREPPFDDGLNNNHTDDDDVPAMGGALETGGYDDID